MKESTTQVKWFRQTNATRWEIDIQDIALGGKSIWSENRKAVIDTFFKTIAIPRNEFNLFKDYLLEFVQGATCDITKGTCQFSGTCATKYALMPDLKLQFEGPHYYILKSTDYLADTVD